MLKLISVDSSNPDSGLATLLKEYGFNVTATRGNLGVVLPDCPVRPRTLLRANIKSWTYFTTIIELRRYYMDVYKRQANTPWEYSEDAKQVTIAINVLGALSHHMSEKIVKLLSNPTKRGAPVNTLTPELLKYVYTLSYSKDPSDTCLKITRMCNDVYGVRSIKCVDSLVNNHLDVYANFSIVLRC